MRTGLAEASNDEALVGKGVQVSLQGGRTAQPDTDT